MRQVLLASALAFVLGTSVGALAIGARNTSESGPPPVDAAVSAEDPDKQTVMQPNPPVTDSAVRVGSMPLADSAPVEPSAVTEIAVGPMSAEEQIAVLTARWTELENRIAGLNARLASLERQRSEAVNDTGTTNERPDRSARQAMTAEDRRSALIAAGVIESQADEIVWRQSEQAMLQLELQDQAIREGWFRSRRYYDELRSVNDEQMDLRAEITEDQYDRYLFETGEPNRVQVSSVIQGSTGEGAGIRSGDVIERYGDQRIFRFNDLRDATTDGDRDELVPVTVRRGDQVFETWMARGPIGVRLEAMSIAPDA